VADLDTPQGSVIRRICQMTGKTIRACAMHNSGGLRIATNFAVNVIHYGYGERAAERVARIWNGRRIPPLLSQPVRESNYEDRIYNQYATYMQPNVMAADQGAV
jgi:hypothetical protein